MATYQLIDREDQVAGALANLGSHRMLAVDCEGVNLGRGGSLTLLQIAARDSPCYLFDIQKLGKRPFDLGLKRILEDKGITKLMFDCKEDSDALFHLYDVCLDGVYDIQLYEVMMRKMVTNAQTRRNGMSRCIDNYLQGNPQLLQIKKRGRNELDQAYDIWARRPMAVCLLEYAAIDTQVLFMLYDYLNKRLPLSMSRNEERLRVSSERFVKYFREKPSRSYDMFERNSFLPLNIIPEVMGGRLNLSVPYGDTQCVGCRKYFPRHDFNSFQLSRRTQQKCRVCMQI